MNPHEFRSDSGVMKSKKNSSDSPEAIEYLFVMVLLAQELFLVSVLEHLFQLHVLRLWVQVRGPPQLLASELEALVHGLLPWVPLVLVLILLV